MWSQQLLWMPTYGVIRHFKPYIFHSWVSSIINFIILDHTSTLDEILSNLLCTPWPTVWWLLMTMVIIKLWMSLIYQREVKVATLVTWKSNKHALNAQNFMNIVEMMATGLINDFEEFTIRDFEEWQYLLILNMGVLQYSNTSHNCISPCDPWHRATPWTAKVPAP